MVILTNIPKIQEGPNTAQQYKLTGTQHKQSAVKARWTERHKSE